MQTQSPLFLFPLSTHTQMQAACKRAAKWSRQKRASKKLTLQNCLEGFEQEIRLYYLFSIWHHWIVIWHQLDCSFTPALQSCGMRLSSVRDSVLFLAHKPIFNTASYHTEIACRASRSSCLLLLLTACRPAKEYSVQKATAQKALCRQVLLEQSFCSTQAYMDSQSYPAWEV